MADHADNPTDTAHRGARGARDAWDFWLSQHDVTVPDLIRAAITDAVTGWLDDHADDVLAAIAAHPDAATQEPR